MRFRFIISWENKTDYCITEIQNLFFEFQSNPIQAPLRTLEKGTGIFVDLFTIQMRLCLGFIYVFLSLTYSLCGTISSLLHLHRLICISIQFIKFGPWCDKLFVLYQLPLMPYLYLDSQKSRCAILWDYPTRTTTRNQGDFR